MSPSSHAPMNHISVREGVFQAPSNNAFWHWLLSHWHQFLHLSHYGNTTRPVWRPYPQHRPVSARNRGWFSNKRTWDLQVQHRRQWRHSAFNKKCWQHVRTWPQILSPLPATLGTKGTGKCARNKNGNQCQWRCSYMGPGKASTHNSSQSGHKHSVFL